MTRHYATSVTVRGLPFDERIVRRARECGDLLASQVRSPCHVQLQAVRRLGSELQVEATVSLEVHGAPVWAIASHVDWSSAIATAFVRAGDRAAAALDWGGSVDIAWGLEHMTEQAS